MPTETHNKLDAAEHQLERALELFLNEKDYLSAITLAGASEEILGRMVDSQDQKNAIQALSSATCAVHLKLFGQELPRKHAIGKINEVRDWLKHYTDGSSLEFDAYSAAYDMIDRAITNFFNVSGPESDLMRSFRESRGGENEDA